MKKRQHADRIGPPVAPRPMHKPVFTETMQIGIVVRDLEATMRRYVDDYGIGSSTR